TIAQPREELKQHSLFKNIFYNSLLSIFNILFPLLMLMYVSRKVGPENIGKVSWAITFTSYFVLIAVFGINNYGIRAIASVREDRDRLDATFSKIFSFSLVTSVIAVTAYIIAVIVMPSMRNKYALFTITGTMVVLSPLSLEWFFLGIENFRYIALRSILLKLASLVLMVIFIKSSDDYLIYALIYVLGLCLNYVFNFAYAMKIVRPVFSFSGADVRAIFKSIYRFALISFVTSLYGGLDKILLGAFAGFIGVGFYTPAEKIVRTFLSVIVAACTTMIPRTSFMIATGKDEEAKSLITDSLHAVLLLAIPLFFGILILAEPLILLFGGSAFLPSVPTLRIMAFIIIPVALANVAGVQVLVACRHEGKYLVSIIAGTIAFLLVAFFSMPKYAQNGAAFAIVLAESVGALLEVYFARFYLRNAWQGKWILPVLVATLLMAGAVYGLELLNLSPLKSLLTSGVAGMVIYFLALYLMRDSIIRRVMKRVLPSIRR
ncbi:MAG: flippase, partial [Rectinemataceae bacterium]|nr:flippase [Rectinemataceae bacterium]